MYTNYATVRISSSPTYFPKGKGNAVTVNNQGKFTNKFIKKNAKLIIDRSSDRERLANSSAIDEMDNRTLEVYRIKIASNHSFYKMMLRNFLVIRYYRILIVWLLNFYMMQQLIL